MLKMKKICAVAVAWTLIAGFSVSCAKSPADTSAPDSAVSVGSSADTLSTDISSTNESSANAATPGVFTPDAAAFVWENATVYFLMTDRFMNGSEENDYSYGRGLDEAGNAIPGIKDSEGGFHGGDFAGITQKINEGYFTELGINAIWITPPYEQIHGFRSADGFAFYAYHGYWGLDFTQPDANYGTEEEFKTMVDAAHAGGIRVVMDVVLNHPGYATMLDSSEYGFGEYGDAWEDYYYGDESSLSLSQEQALLDEVSPEWQGWWGPDWIRSADGLAGYDAAGTTDELLCLSGLPDFKTESSEEVELPAFLVEKWTAEGRLEEEVSELDAFFEENDLPRTVLNYEIKWLTDWVSKYGIDGFRCDTAKHVDLACWQTLKGYASGALDEWRLNNPDKVIDDTPFWTVGEVWDHGVVKDDYYTAGSFDALLNFSFRKNITNYSILPDLYIFMSDTMREEDFNVLSYISSHDQGLFMRSNLIKGGSALLLSPGSVQIFYGDETSRTKAWEDAVYEDLKFRSDMNWDSIDQEVLLHFRILGQFRIRHAAIGAGEHIQISQKPFIFARVYENDGETDEIVAVITDPDQDVVIPVSDIFGDGMSVRNAYDGTTATVADGEVTFNSGVNGVILLENAV